MFPNEQIQVILDKVRMAGLKNNRRPICTEHNQLSIQQGLEEIKRIFITAIKAEKPSPIGGGVVSTSSKKRKK